MQTKMVDVSLLSHAEIDWLNSYHAEVWEKVSPHKTCMFLASQIISTHGFTFTYSISCLHLDVSFLAGFTFVRRSYSAMALEQHSSISQIMIEVNQVLFPLASSVDLILYDYNQNLLPFICWFV